MSRRKSSRNNSTCASYFREREPKELEEGAELRDLQQRAKEETKSGDPQRCRWTSAAAESVRPTPGAGHCRVRQLRHLDDFYHRFHNLAGTTIQKRTLQSVFSPANFGGVSTLHAAIVVDAVAFCPEPAKGPGMRVQYPAVVMRAAHKFRTAGRRPTHERCVTRVQQFSYSYYSEDERR